MSTATYLDRFLQPVTHAMTPELARAIIQLRTDPDLQTEVEELRRKANEGTLTELEDTKYKDFVEAVDVVSIIQSKARQFLKNQQA